MKPLKDGQLATHREVRVKVNSGSLIRVQKNAYSVPTSLIGQRVTVQIHEWHLEVYFRGHLMLKLPRLIGKNRHHVNYRHVIDSLLRKPGGFRNYRYRDDLFPTLIFCRAWEQINQWYAPRKADLIYLRVLKLAARTMESEVANALEYLVATGEQWDDTDLDHLLHPEPIVVPQLSCGQVELTQYDRLLSEASYVA